MSDYPFRFRCGGTIAAIQANGAEDTRRDGPIRVIVVDDHDLYRIGLVSLLSAQQDMEVVAQASGGRAGVRLAREFRPDVILMDVSMPDTGGIEATRKATEHDPAVRVVMLTVSADEASVAGAVRAGACGYVLKDSPIDQIVGAVRAAADGHAWLSSRAAETLLDRVRRGSNDPSPVSEALASLTPREVDVLRLLQQGCENADIAKALHMSRQTAKRHVSSILSKLHVSNRVQAAVFAAEHRLG